MASKTAKAQPGKMPVKIDAKESISADSYGKARMSYERGIVVGISLLWNISVCQTERYLFLHSIKAIKGMR